MTQAEMASVMSGGGNNYSPLALSALTNNAMGYLPDAQYMTPSQYGAFRTLPQMAYQQPVNQNPGYFKSLAMTFNGFAPHFYNPAASAIQQRVEASRYVHDTNAAMMSAGIGTAADLGLLAAGVMGGGALAMPLLALQLAGAMLPLHLQGTQEHIANTRALQRLTRGKIVGGRDVDTMMGSGFSTRAARNLDKHLYRESLHDALYDDEDYRKMLGEGIQAGVFDYDGTAEQYKKTLKLVRDNLSTLMEVTGSQDFADSMKELKRLQDMGASQQNWKSILRKENMYSRITGLSHSDMVNTYGQMGALEFSQRGLSNIQGSQIAMHNAAVVTMGQRNGTMSAAYVAANGGVSGMAQKMTEGVGQSMQAYDQQLLLAAYDPTTGKMKKGFKLSDYQGEDGLQRLQRDAAKTADILTRQGYDAKLKFRRNRHDVRQELETSEGGAVNIVADMGEIIGRNIVGNRAKGKSRNELRRLGLVATGMSDDDAYNFVDGLGAMQYQQNYELKQAKAKELIEIKKKNIWFRKMFREAGATISEWWDDITSMFTDAKLKSQEYTDRINSGMMAVETTPTVVSNLVQNEFLQEAPKTTVDEKKSDASGMRFGDYISQRTANAQAQNIGYDANSANSGRGAINDFGWVKETMQGTMAHYNQITPDYFNKDFMQMVAGSTTREDLLKSIGNAGGGLVDLSTDVGESQLRNGMIIGTNTGDKSAASGELGVNKTAQVFKDAQGNWMVSESDAKGGVHTISYKDWRAQQEAIAKENGSSLKVLAGDTMQANRNMGGGSSDMRELTAEEKAKYENGDDAALYDALDVNSGMYTGDMYAYENASDLYNKTDDSLFAENDMRSMSKLSSMNRMSRNAQQDFEGNFNALGDELTTKYGVKVDSQQLNEMFSNNLDYKQEDPEEFLDDAVDKYAGYIANKKYPNNPFLREHYKEQVAAEINSSPEKRERVGSLAYSSNGARGSVAVNSLNERVKKDNADVNERIQTANLNITEKLNSVANEMTDSEGSKKVEEARNGYIEKGGTLVKSGGIEGLAWAKRAFDAASTSGRDKKSNQAAAQRAAIKYAEQLGISKEDAIAMLEDSKKFEEGIKKVGGKNGVDYYKTILSTKLKGDGSDIEEMSQEKALTRSELLANAKENAQFNLTKLGVEVYKDKDGKVRFNTNNARTEGMTKDQLELFKKAQELEKQGGASWRDIIKNFDVSMGDDGKIISRGNTEKLIKQQEQEVFAKDQTNNLRRTADATEDTAAALKVLTAKWTGKTWEEATKDIIQHNKETQDARMNQQKRGG